MASDLGQDQLEELVTAGTDGANLINIVLNFFLIYPTRTAVLFGAPVTLPGAGLGVTGAAITVILHFAGII